MFRFPASSHFEHLTGYERPCEEPAQLNEVCSFPRRKRLIKCRLEYRISNCVLLQAAWKVSTWAITFWLEKKNPDAKFCAGCAQNLASDSSAAAAAAHSEADRLAGPYEMFRMGVVGLGATHYVQPPHVHVGDTGEGTV